jgi:type VI secretion system protein ImpH
LGFSPGEVAALDWKANGTEARLTVGFFGLYGAPSPLPSRYTEDLFEDEREGRGLVRDFFDIFNDRLLSLLFDVWAKYRLFIGQADGGTDIGAGAPSARALLDALGGGIDASAGDTFRFSPLAAQRVRSGAALAALVSEALGHVPVTCLPCRERRLSIPSDQRCRLGESSSVLGADLRLGDEAVDRAGAFRLRIGPLRRAAFRSLVEGGESQARLAHCVADFLPDPLAYDAEVLLAEGELVPSRLGDTDSARLGVDLWLQTPGPSPALAVVLGGTHLAN